MTYRNSLQGRFVATGYPAVGMLVVSLFLWALSAVRGVGWGCTLPVLWEMGDIASRAISLLAYVAAAFVLGNMYLFERRVPFLPAVFMWLTAVLPFVQPCHMCAISLLLLLIAVVQLLECDRSANPQRVIYGAFAMLTASSLVAAQLLLLLPLFVAYIFVARVARASGIAAALLGVLTPLWLLWGGIYVFPPMEVLVLPAKQSLAAIVPFTGLCLPPLLCASLAMEVLVLVVAASIYATSSYPAKPLLRRRLLFLLMLDAYMLLLTLVFPHDSLLFLVWRMPVVAVMASYVFSMKVTKVSNIYFVSLNVAWLLIAVICLWMG